jgi:hypothetical protein
MNKKHILYLTLLLITEKLLPMQQQQQQQQQQQEEKVYIVVYKEKRYDIPESNIKKVLSGHCPGDNLGLIDINNLRNNSSYENINPYVTIVSLVAQAALYDLSKLNLNSITDLKDKTKLDKNNQIALDHFFNFYPKDSIPYFPQEKKNFMALNYVNILLENILKNEDNTLNQFETILLNMTKKKMPENISERKEEDKK